LTGSLDKAVLEAMACGAIVLSCNDAVAEMLGNYKDILIFEKNNERDLSDRVKKIIAADDHYLIELRKSLKEIVVSGHGLPGLVRKILQIFDSNRAIKL
jgi:glycosyltransferase involved in cell wall biosynthesis